MKFIENKHGPDTVELTRRNLQILLDKLDDPLSACTIEDPDRRVLVKAVEDDQHYQNRLPGLMFMPSTGEY